MEEKKEEAVFCSIDSRVVVNRLNQLRRSQDVSEYLYLEKALADIEVVKPKLEVEK